MIILEFMYLSSALNLRLETLEQKQALLLQRVSHTEIIVRERVWSVNYYKNHHQPGNKKEPQFILALND